MARAEQAAELKKAKKTAEERRDICKSAVSPGKNAGKNAGKSAGKKRDGLGGQGGHCPWASAHQLYLLGAWP